MKINNVISSIKALQAAGILPDKMGRYISALVVLTIGTVFLAAAASLTLLIITILQIVY